MTNFLHYLPNFQLKFKFLNRFCEAPRDNFRFGGNVSYFTLCLADNLAVTNFLHYPQLPS